MKNKGFTLVELLAVIVILAIIALIAVPIILGIINDSKKQSEDRSAELYLDAAKKAIASYQASHPDEDFSDIRECSITANNIVCGGRTIPVEMSGQIPNDGGKILLTNGNVTKVENLNLGGKYYSTDANNRLVASDTPVEDQGFTGTIYTTSSKIVRLNESIEPTTVEGKYCGVIYGDMNSCNVMALGMDSEEECETIMAGFGVDNPECVIGSVTTGYSSDDYVESASDIEEDFYLKHVVANNIIQESYVCVKNSASNTGETCLQGANYFADPNQVATAYAANYAVLEGLNEDSAFNEIGRCDLSDSQCRIIKGSNEIVFSTSSVPYEDTAVYYSKDSDADGECVISNLGTAHCEF